MATHGCRHGADRDGEASHVTSARHLKLNARVRFACDFGGYGFARDVRVDRFLSRIAMRIKQNAASRTRYTAIWRSSIINDPDHSMPVQRRFIAKIQNAMANI